MRVGILTHYHVDNQGALLQMFALSKVLQKMGCEVVILEYERNYDFGSSTLSLKYNIGVKSVPYFIKEYVVKRGLGNFVYNVKKHLILKDFKKENFLFEKYSRSQVDAVVIGSDEVFSLEYGINFMMFGHAIGCSRIVAYAPSFGQTDLKAVEERRCGSLIAAGLKQMEHISVRDANTFEIVKHLSGIEAPIVCDPVILHDFSKEIRKLGKVKVPAQKYLLVYSYDANMNKSEEINAIKAYARKKGLLVVSAGTYHSWCDRNILADPLEWLYLFTRAEAVITDTFHGSIASIITNRPMAVLLRNNTNKLFNLLLQYGLTDRILKDINEIEEVMSKDIDFEYVNLKISENRKGSEEFLRRALFGSAYSQTLSKVNI